MGFCDHTHFYDVLRSIVGRVVCKKQKDVRFQPGEAMAGADFKLHARIKLPHALPGKQRFSQCIHKQHAPLFQLVLCRTNYTALPKKSKRKQKKKIFILQFRRN